VVIRKFPPPTLGEDMRHALCTLACSIEPPDNPARYCLEIELALSKYEFDGLPLGSALTDLLGSAILRKTVSSSMKAYGKELLGYAVHHLKVVEQHGSGNQAIPATGGGRILVGLISHRTYHRTWVPRFVQYLGADRVWVFSNDEVLRSGLPTGALASKWCELPPLEMKLWRAEYARVSSSWRSELRRLRHRCGISRTTEIGLMHGLLVASQRVLRFGRLLDTARPGAVLVEYDRNVRGACLVLAARRRGIPTFTLLHGVINGPFGYTPVVADTVLCWGDFQRTQLIELGTPAERIHVVGFERLEDGLVVDGAAVRKRLGIPGDVLVVVLATNPIGERGRQKLVRFFCEAVSRAPGVVGMVRLHPSEELEDYREVADAFPGIRFTANSDLPAEAVFALSDVIVVHSSGFGAEGLVRGKPCAVLDVLDSPLGHGMDLVRHAGAPRLGGVSELVSFLARYREDEGFRRELKEDALKFAGEMFAARGEAACRNIAKAVLEGANPWEGECGIPRNGEAEA